MATVTPIYNWPVPTSTDYVKDGATAIESLGDAIDSTLSTALGGNYPGLRLVKSQAIGTGVSSVVVTDAFSATYQGYKIVVTGGVASTNTRLTIQLGASTSAYYSVLANMNYTANTLSGSNSNNGANFTFAGNADTNSLQMNVDLFNPFLAKYTYTNGHYITTTSAGPVTGIHQVATSYTGFTMGITTGGATLTGGTIYVYGYGAS
jgi:hypothetical protein